MVKLSIMPLSSVTLLNRFWVNGSFSPAIMVSVTSFTDYSDEVVFLCWLSNFFLKLYLSLFAQKASYGVNTYQHILTYLNISNWLGCLGWKGSHWKHIAVGFVTAIFIHVVAALVNVLCWHFGLEFVVAVVCTIMLKVGSSHL